MKTINIGVANLIVSNHLKESYFTNTSLNESKGMASNFIDVVKGSPLLQLEFKVFDLLENKHIPNDESAIRFLNKNIMVFETYTIEELEEENAKVQSFINENVDNNLDKKRLELYTAIGGVIEESVKAPEDVDIDLLHESTEFVLNHLKTPKNEIVKVEDKEFITETVVEIAVEKFNEKYSDLNESDKTLLKTLVNADTATKKAMFEEYASGNVELLSGLNEAKYSEKISKTIQKIEEMKFNPETVEEDIIDLYELKKGLL